MKRFLVTFAALWALTLAASHRAAADPDLPQDDTPNSRRVFPPGKPVEAERPFSGARYYRSQRHVYSPRSYDSHPGALRFPPPRPWPYPYPYRPYYYERYYYAPLYIPAERLYGPQALARFLGWDTFNRRPPTVNVLAPEENADNEAGGPKGIAPREPNLRGTNQKALALGWKFIGYGDAHFANEKYSDAYGRYRKAVRAAPQLAAGYFRQGYALAAVGRYELAAKALKRGLALDPLWPASGFSNDELYGRNELAKTTHLDAMAKAAEGRPHDADLMFLLGVYFHFDGEPDRAAIFFRRAAPLVGADDAHLKAFMRN